MGTSPTKRYELRVEVFKALAHPMRLFLLDKIKERPRCVCDLAEEVGIDKSVASKHLSQLKRAGLIEDAKRGTLIEYRLVAPCVLDLAACAEGAIVAARKKGMFEAEARQELVGSLSTPGSRTDA
ncbi:MAG: metalloregulator ArsR/SmtB family transcription factor [Treponema sp.]|nr:metalloregulator ArsR/SmtB family transcription factor [Treponema sp.]